jgi:hypothetical protein
MTNTIRLWTLATLLIGVYQPAFACNLAGYDSGPPPRLTKNIDDGTVLFSWASDVDQDQDGRTVFWNYIWNLHKTKGWGGAWAKGQIRVNPAFPLPPGDSSCVSDYIEHPKEDHNAPIVYGTSGTEVPAAVFVADEQETKVTSSHQVNTTFIGEGGKKQSINLEFSIINQSDGSVDLKVESNKTDYFVAITNIDKFLSDNQRDVTFGSAKEAGALIMYEELVDRI